MVISLKALLNDWKYGRSIILAFLEELSEEDLTKELPRKKQNTIRLQIEELVWIQRDFLDALSTKKLTFTEEKNLVSVNSLPKHEIKGIMGDLDAKLENILRTSTGNEIIDHSGSTWHGGGMKNIHEHISILLGHEQMHIGQIIGFCHAVGIDIPQSIVTKMMLGD